MSVAILAQALCDAMLWGGEYPSYLRARWADIDGIVPPARRETEAVTMCPAKTERDQKGNAGSGSRNMLKSLEVEEPKKVELELS